jgi:hypothetical protein
LVRQPAAAAMRSAAILASLATSTVAASAQMRRASIAVAPVATSVQTAPRGGNPRARRESANAFATLPALVLSLAHPSLRLMAVPRPSSSSRSATRCYPTIPS